MNVLIVDPSVMPDVTYQHRLVRHFGGAANIRIRFATGVLQATWQTRDFSPDAIVFDRIGNCEQQERLVAMLRRINPDLSMFHLEGGSLIAIESPCAVVAELAVPYWLRDITMHWLLARAGLDQGAGA